MVDLLLEVTNNRDYRLKIVWGCRICAKTVTVFLDRTKEEAEAGERNIKQKCFDGHVTTPFKQCTVCHTIYRLNEFVCLKCEPIIKQITELELALEDAEKNKKQYDADEIKVELERLIAIRKTQHAK